MGSKGHHTLEGCAEDVDERVESGHMVSQPWV